MKLSVYIKQLEEFLKDNGDLEVIYSVDSEGNAFHKVFYEPSIGHYAEEDKEFYDEDSMLERNDEVERNNELYDSDEELIHFNAVCVN